MTFPLGRLLNSACLASFPLLAGCYSTATLHTARPIEEGEVQTAAALGAFLGEDDGDVSALPTLEGQVRFGINERLDLGVHVTNLGSFAVDANYALLLTENQAVSIDPAVELSFGAYAWLPLLWDFYQTDSLTLTGSVRAGRYWVDLDNDEDFLLDELEGDAWLYGGGLAAHVRLTDTVVLTPEVRAMWLDIDEGERLSSPLISFSLGFIF